MDKEVQNLKICFLGGSQVGKTSLINSIMGFEFQDQIPSSISGIKCEKSYVINGKKYNLEIWDSAGQERYQSLTKLFIKGSQIIILVYDITEPISFKVLKDWINISNKIISNEYIMGIIGNKYDLYLDMEVPEEEVVEIAKFYNCPFYLVSAKTMPDKCNEIIVKLVEEYLGRFPEEKEKEKEIFLIKRENNNKKERNNCLCGSSSSYSRDINYNYSHNTNYNNTHKKVNKKTNNNDLALTSEIRENIDNNNDLHKYSKFNPERENKEKLTCWERFKAKVCPCV